MNEYISKKKAIAIFIEGAPDDNDFTLGYNFAVDEYREKIKAMKAADVQPVKRGRWVKCGKLEGKIVMKCSVCEQGITAMFAPKYHYCPNCGARMDGDINV